jgi:putative DNA primase/helicase
VTAVTTLTGSSAREPAPAVKTVHRNDDSNERKNFERAEAIWSESLPLGPVAIAYFAKRRIDINAVPRHGGLRFNERCPWGSGTTPRILGQFTTAIGNEPRGIWRRPITSETPMSLGPTAGCVIRLWPEEAVDRRLVLGEGPETVLAAATCIQHRGALLLPAWAAGSAGAIGKFPILPGV